MLRLVRSSPAVLGWVSIACLAAPAFAHDLNAQAQNDSETTTDVADAIVEAHGEFGTVGEDLSYVVSDAFVNAASGASSLDSNLQWVDGAFFPGSLARTRLSENLAVDGPTGSRRLRVTLGVDLNGSVVNAGPAGARIEVDVLLYLGPDCRVLLGKDLFPGDTSPASIVPDCDAGIGVASGDPSQLVIESNDLPFDTYVRVDMAAESKFFGVGDSGQIELDTTLRVEALDGSTWTAESPLFLTEVPEPGTAWAGLAAIATCGVVAPRQRMRSASSRKR
jgi:hypothetical protein